MVFRPLTNLMIIDPFPSPCEVIVWYLIYLKNCSKTCVLSVSLATNEVTLRLYISEYEGEGLCHFSHSSYDDSIVHILHTYTILLGRECMNT